MFYRAADKHDLPYDPFKAIVSPRPIGWISTVDESGRPNLAPYSFFNAMASRPNMIGFTSEKLKQSMRNARDTGEFVFNMVSLSLVHAMNLTSVEIPDVNEFDYAKVEMAPCCEVAAPRVAASPASLECKTVHFAEFRNISGEQTDRYLVVGQVVGVHMDDRFITDGRFDVARAQLVGRCGYRDYVLMKDLFDIQRP